MRTVPSIYDLDMIPSLCCGHTTCEHFVFYTSLTIDRCKVLNEVPTRSVYFCFPIHRVSFRVTTQLARLFTSLCILDFLVYTFTFSISDYVPNFPILII